MNTLLQSICCISISYTLLLAGCSGPRQVTSAPEIDQSPPKQATAPETALDGTWIYQWHTIGYSTQSKPIVATSLGRGARKVLIIAGIHGDEPEGLYILDEVMTMIAEDKTLTDQIAFRVIKDMNPDGMAVGNRFNPRGVDLNRNWPTSNFKPAKKHGPKPLSEPETRCVHTLIEVFKPDMVIVFHSTKRGPFINFDGPAKAHSEAWVAAANQKTNAADKKWKVVPSMGYPTPGSLGTFAGVDRNIPIMTVEFLMGQSPDRYREAGLAGLKASLSQALPMIQ